MERSSPGGELFRVIGRGAKLEERQDGKKLLRIRIAAEQNIECGRQHLDGFARYAELADAIEKRLEETGR